MKNAPNVGDKMNGLKLEKTRLCGVASDVISRKQETDIIEAVPFNLYYFGVL